MVARRAGTLSQGGAAAATLTGTICAAAGWGWAFVLIAFFVSATVLSVYKQSFKKETVGEFVVKGGRRDAVQVAANGGVFTLLAAASLVRPSPIWIAAAAVAGWAGAPGTGAAQAASLAQQISSTINTLEARPTGRAMSVT